MLSSGNCCIKPVRNGYLRGFARKLITVYTTTTRLQFKPWIFLTLNVIYCIITARVSYRGDILFCDVWTFCLIASCQPVSETVCEEWFPLVLWKSCKGSNFPSAVWKQRDGARKGELVRTVRYYRDVMFFVWPQTGIQRGWKELFLWYWRLSSGTWRYVVW
jgi:hypothetical protein